MDKVFTNTIGGCCFCCFILVSRLASEGDDFGVKVANVATDVLEDDVAFYRCSDIEDDGVA